MKPLLTLNPLAFSIWEPSLQTFLTGQFKSFCSMTALITYHTPSSCFPLPPTISLSFQFSFVPIHSYSLWPNQSHCVSRAGCPLCVNAASNNPLLHVFVYVCESVLGTDSSEMGFWTSPLSLQNRHQQIFKSTKIFFPHLLVLHNVFNENHKSASRMALSWIVSYF